MMNTRNGSKEEAQEFKHKVRGEIDSVTDKLSTNAESLRQHIADWEEQLRDVGSRLLDSAKELGGTASKQVKMHPLAAFGLAFTAGVLVTRMFRR